MKLSPEQQIPPTPAIIDAISQEFELPVLSWSEVHEGIGNTVLRLSSNGKDYFAKCYTANHSREALHDELYLLEHARSVGVPVPKLLHSSTSRSATALIGAGSRRHFTTVSECIEGTHPTHYSAQIIKELAAFHAMLHTTSLTSLSERHLRMTDYHLASDQPDFTADIDNLLHELNSQIAERQKLLPVGLCHCDITRTNILQRADHITGIIDFEDTTEAPYAFCLAGTLWDIYSSSNNLTLLALYITEYQNVRTLTQLERDILPILVAERGWLALHGDVLSDNPSRAVQTKQQLMTYLSLAVAT